MSDAVRERLSPALDGGPAGREILSGVPDGLAPRVLARLV